MAAPEKVSFTIRRPTPVSRAPSSGPDSDSTSYKIPSLPRHVTNGRDSTPGSPLARSSTSSPNPAKAVYIQHDPDSSDEDNKDKDELVTGFDRFGVRRVDNNRPIKASPLVIPPLKNRDWRELARKRRSAAQYVPPSAQATTGKDGSVGGLGTRDSINSGPVLSGLQYKKESTPIKQEDEPPNGVPPEDVKMDVEEEDEDKAALRAILAGTDGPEHDGPIVDIIPTPVSEADAYKQDVQELPDAATLDDYARVPVAQFGAALLRGMGWKEGTAATRKPGKGLVEPYLPESRPALLGIGAKEQEVYDDGGKKKGGVKRPEKRYVPLVKKEREDRPSSATQDFDRRRERSRSPHSRSGGSTAVSRRSSKERGSDRDDRRRDTSERRDERDRDRDYRRDDRDRDRDLENRRENREYKRSERDRDRPRDNTDQERRRDRSRDSNRRRRD